MRPYSTVLIASLGFSLVGGSATGAVTDLVNRLDITKGIEWPDAGSPNPQYRFGFRMDASVLASSVTVVPPDGDGWPDPSGLMAEFAGNPLILDRNRTGVDITFGGGTVDHDVRFVFLTKIRRYKQLSADAPAPGDSFGDDHFGFGVNVQATTPTSVDAARVTFPDNQTTHALTNAGDGWWEWGGNAAQQTQLDSLFPNGTYALTIDPRQDNGGSPRQVALSLTDDGYPPAPAISNWAALQAVDPAVAMTVSWVAWPDATTADGVYVEIFSRSPAGDRDTVWRSALFGESGAVDGTQTQVQIPSGLLQTGLSYYGEISFVRPASPPGASGYPNAFNMAGYMSSTVFPVTLIPTGIAAHVSWVEINKGMVWRDPASTNHTEYGFDFTMTTDDTVIQVQVTPPDGDAQQFVIAANPAGSTHSSAPGITRNGEVSQDPATHTAWWRFQARFETDYESFWQATYKKGWYNVLLPWYDKSAYRQYGLPELGVFALRPDAVGAGPGGIEPLRRALVSRAPLADGYGDYFEIDPNETPGAYDMLLPAEDLTLALVENCENRPGWGGYLRFHAPRRIAGTTPGHVLAGQDFTATTADVGVLRGQLTVPAGYGPLTEDWCSVSVFPEDRGDLTLPVAVGRPGWTLEYEIGSLPAGTYVLQVYARNLPQRTVDHVVVTADATTTANVDFGSSYAYAFDLAPGWNLVSAPVDSRQQISHVLVDGQGASLSQGVVSAWDGVAGQYVEVRQSDPLPVQTGLWLYSPNGGVTRPVEGPVAAGAVPLVTGWNLVGPATVCRPPEVAGLRPTVWQWDAVTQAYRAVAVRESLLPGQAYWFYADIDIEATLRAEP